MLYIRFDIHRVSVPFVPYMYVLTFNDAIFSFVICQIFVVYVCYYVTIFTLNIGTNHHSCPNLEQGYFPTFLCM